VDKNMKQLLVIIEKDCDQITALERAIALCAGDSECSIDVAAFVYAKGIDDSNLLNEEEQKQVRGTLIEQKQHWLSQKVNTIETNGCEVKCEVYWEKHVHQWTIERCEQKVYDMVVKTHNEDKKNTYSPIEWNLLRSCTVPVMIVKDPCWDSQKPIVAAIDLAHQVKERISLNIEVIKMAEQLARVTQQKIQYVYSLSLPKIIADLEIIDEVAFKKKAKKEAKENLTKYYNIFDINFDDIHIKYGSPQQVISRCAKKVDADIVVMGTHGRTGISGAIIGNTAEAVLHHIKTDVLTIKS
jgi:universal stress protein E